MVVAVITFASNTTATLESDVLLVTTPPAWAGLGAAERTEVLKTAVGGRLTTTIEVALSLLELGASEEIDPLRADVVTILDAAVANITLSAVEAAGVLLVLIKVLPSPTAGSAATTVGGSLDRILGKALIRLNAADDEAGFGKAMLEAKQNSAVVLSTIIDSTLTAASGRQAYDKAISLLTQVMTVGQGLQRPTSVKTNTFSGRSYRLPPSAPSAVVTAGGTDVVFPAVRELVAGAADDDRVDLHVVSFDANLARLGQGGASNATAVTLPVGSLEVFVTRNGQRVAVRNLSTPIRFTLALSSEQVAARQALGAACELDGDQCQWFDPTINSFVAEVHARQIVGGVRVLAVICWTHTHTRTHTNVHTQIYTHIHT